jgi:S-adenosylmethionine:tRNA ribosyltransferase-isomerase
MHQERYEVSEEAAGLINQAKKGRHRVFCVGTTSLRVVESVAAKHGRMVAGRGTTRIFIYPPFNFKIADALLTNFHLPESTLMMLVSAFASPGRLEGRELILNAYNVAVRERYRFFSFGDAMLIL